MSIIYGLTVFVKGKYVIIAQNRLFLTAEPLTIILEFMRLGGDFDNGEIDRKVFDDTADPSETERARELGFRVLKNAGVAIGAIGVACMFEGLLYNDIRGIVIGSASALPCLVLERLGIDGLERTRAEKDPTPGLE